MIAIRLQLLAVHINTGARNTVDCGRASGIGQWFAIYARKAQVSSNPIYKMHT